MELQRAVRPLVRTCRAVARIRALCSGRLGRLRPEPGFLRRYCRAAEWLRKAAGLHCLNCPVTVPVGVVVGRRRRPREVPDERAQSRFRFRPPMGAGGAPQSLAGARQRACLAGSLPTGALAGALSDLPDADPGSNDRLIDLGVAVAAAAVLVLLLRRFGQDQGILFGLKLTILSYLFWQALVAAAYAAWLAAGIDGPTDWGLIGFTAAFSAALFIPSDIMPRKLDPDF